MKYFQKFEKNFAGPAPATDLDAAISDFQKKIIFTLLFLFVLNMFVGNS